MIKIKLILIIFVLFIFLVLSTNFVLPVCPSVVDTPNEFRNRLRIITLDFLSDPASSPYTTEEIQDLLEFYVSEKDKPSITDCNILSKRSNERIDVLLKRSIGDIECFPGDTQPCGQTDEGACEFGTLNCQSTYLWGSCIGEVKPSTEICDNIDNNCDGNIDDGCDDDSDTYADKTITCSGSFLDGSETRTVRFCSTNSEDCDDLDLNVNPGVVEKTCDNDNIDNNCDGVEAPTCIIMSLSSDKESIKADELESSTIKIVISDSESGVEISFSSNRPDDILSSTSCITGNDGKCSITIKSSNPGTSIITATSPLYSDATFTITFTNEDPTVQPIIYAEKDTPDSNIKGSTITLQCTVDDVDAHDNPVKDKLTVKLWAGQCDNNDCLATRSWDTGAGVTYYDDVFMDAPTTGNTFTKSLTIIQDPGTGLAATCQPIDSKGAGNSYGDAYPLLVVGCPDIPPTFSNILVFPDPAKPGTLTITFTASNPLILNPTVALKNTVTEIEIGTATFSSKNILDYTYSYTISNSNMNGLTEVAIKGQISAETCSQGSSFSTFNIDTQAPIISVSHSPANPTESDVVTVSASGNDIVLDPNLNLYR